MNDLQAAELISKSLASDLTADERQLLDEHLAQSVESRALVEISGVVERVLRSASAPGSTITNQDPDARLSSLSKERMRRAIRAALPPAPNSSVGNRYSSEAAVLQVAEQETTYFRAESTEESVPEQRQTEARFVLLRKIGQGGLGTVWLARDERLNRNVALKELNPQAAESEKLWQRFAREAEITGHLEHPNVVPLYISGINAATGLPFYAMRFLGKQTLSDAIREYHAVRQGAADDPIHLHRLLNAFLDVCQAIAFAHARGVVHRDLKPENVALDNFGQVLVLDWGLAKLESDGELATRLALVGHMDIDSVAQTLDGEVVGTPLYMAPEQAAGDMHHLDQRTDVYGLGAILFAILTGDAPHANSYRSFGPNSKLKDVLQLIANSETPRPRDINVHIPRDLELICMRAMSKEKYARHASAQELASEVESWIAGRHRLQARYEALRLAGRDLKSRLCVQVRQLAVTAQFMVELPPIRGLSEPSTTPGAPAVAGCAEELAEFQLWKERLSTVLRALAKTNPTLHALSYLRLCNDRVSELVRIERSRHDVANIRALPNSRLRRSAANIFHKTTLEQFPGECHIDFDLSVVGLTRIVAGVPVFEPLTEEPFGLVMAEAEIGRLVQRELEASQFGHTLYLIDDKGQILYSNQRSLQTVIAQASQEIERWPDIVQALNETGEYTEAECEYYATQLMFPHTINNSLRIVLHVSK